MMSLLDAAKAMIGLGEPARPVPVTVDSDAQEKRVSACFEEKRDELLALVDEGGRLPDLPESMAQSLEDCRRTCHESLFNVVLVAPFQGGKSTTVNAFADGREISPRGLGGGGLKTSACAIRVRNLMDPAAEERACIRWRTAEELTLRLDEVLGNSLRELVPELRRINDQAEAEVERFGQDSLEANEIRERTRGDYLARINVARPEGRQLLRKAIEREMSLMGHPRRSETEMELLRFAALVVYFYNDPCLAELRQRQEFAVDEFQRLVQFPEDWESRWRGFDPKRFTPEEIAFVFIDQVDCHIHSRNLRLTGMAIVDCPGLFASSFDTAVARSAMRHGDAIWYLVEAQRGPEQHHQKAWEMIRDHGFAEKTFFSANFKSAKPTIEHRILPEVEAVLARYFPDVSRRGVPLYNAFLALRAMQGERLLQGTLDPLTARQIVLDAEAMGCDFLQGDARSAWLESTVEVLRTTKLPCRNEVERRGLHEETVRLLLEASGWEHEMARIQNYVIDRKAHSLLVDRGAKRISDAVGEVEQRLRQIEQNAVLREEEAKEQWGKARRDLATYHERCQEIMGECFDDSWEADLAGDVWDRVIVPLPAIVAGNAAETLVQNPSSKERVNEEVNKEFQEALQELSEKWYGTLRAGAGNRIYEERVIARVRLALRRFEEAGTQYRGETFLEDLLPPEVTGEILPDITSCQEGCQDALALCDDVDAGIAAGVVLGGAAGVGGLYAVLFALGAVLPGFGWLAAGIGAVIGAVWAAIVGEEKFRNEIRGKIEDGLRKNLDEYKHEILAQAGDHLRSIRAFYENVFQSHFAKQKEVLEQRIAKSEADFRLSQQQREANAAQAHRVRTGQMEPLRARLEGFIRSVEQLWPERGEDR